MPFAVSMLKFRSPQPNGMSRSSTVASQSAIRVSAKAALWAMTELPQPPLVPMKAIVWPATPLAGSANRSSTAAVNRAGSNGVTRYSATPWRTSAR